MKTDDIIDGLVLQPAQVDSGGKFKSWEKGSFVHGNVFVLLTGKIEVIPETSHNQRF